MTTDALFPKPTSVVIVGDDRPLLNWIAYALASINDPGFIWTDIRCRGQKPDSTGPMSRGVIPSDRLIVQNPVDLTPNEAAASFAVSVVVRDDEPPQNIRRLVDYLRIPTAAQKLLSIAQTNNHPTVLVMSNAHRIEAFYQDLESTTSAVRSMVESGAIPLMTCGDAPADVRLAFETIIHVEGCLRDGWKRATLRVERGPSGGAFSTGFVVRLGDFVPLASVLSRALDQAGP